MKFETREARSESKDSSSSDKVRTRSSPITLTESLQRFSIDPFPIFNIWDALCLVYTLSCEPVYSSRRSELHLYQFHLMAKALSEWVDAVGPCPSTVGATWTKETPSRQPLLVAFGFSGVTKPNHKKNLTAARRDFCNSLFP